MTDAKFQQMTTSRVEKLILQMSGPTITIMLVSAMYNVADTYFVSFLGTQATAALGVAFSLMAIIQATGFFFGNGAGNYISRALGARNSAGAIKMAATGFFTAFVTGTLAAILGLTFLEPLARLLGATETILPYTMEYLRYVVIGMPFMICAFMLNNCLRFQGNTFWSMVGMTSGAILNVVLDPIFIFTFNWGMTGAALATLISQMFSFGLLLWLSCTQKENLPIVPREFTPTLKTYKEIVRGGTPSMLRQTLLSVSTIFIIHAAGSFGDAAIAAISIVMRIIQFLNAAMLGLAQGFQPVCGFNFGAQLYDRVKQAYWFCVKLVLGILSTLAVICLICAPQIISIFKINDPRVVEIGALTLRMQCLTLPLAGWIIIDNMLLQMLGKVMSASLLSLARQGLFLMPLVFVLVYYFGLWGLQIAMPIADTLTFVLAVYLSSGTLRRDLS